MEQRKASPEEDYIARHKLEITIGQGRVELGSPDESDHEEESKHGQEFLDGINSCMNVCFKFETVPV